MKANKRLSLMFLWSAVMLVAMAMAKTPVEINGELRVDGNQIVGEHGNPVQLMGMSMYWSIWNGQDYYKQETVEWLVDDWNIDLIRAAMGVSEGSAGWMFKKEAQYGYVDSVIAGAVKKGIYVIVDWHTHVIHLDGAKEFFGRMAEKYKDCPNIIWELFNEPTTQKWDTIAAYHEEIIKVIREHSDNLILAGTRTWCQAITEPANKPLSDKNTAYVVHFYAGSHGAGLRKNAETAMNKGIAVFISEWGTTAADGGNEDKTVYTDESSEWIEWALSKNISMANWSVVRKGESSAVIKATGYSGWDPETGLSESGKFIRNWIREINGEKYGESGTVKLTVTVEGPGTVTVSPKKDEYEKNEKVTLTAAADNGGKFLYWSGSVEGDEKSVTLTMSSTKRVTAKFFAIDDPLIKNGDFSDSTANWSSYVNTATKAKGTFTVKDNQVVVDIEDTGSAAWNIQMFQGNIVLVDNYRYELTFEAKAAAERDMVASVKRNSDPYDEYAVDTIALGTEFKTYKLQFVKKETDPDARIEFNFGQFSSESVYLKNVKFVLVDTLSAKKIRHFGTESKKAVNFSKTVSKSFVLLNFETKNIANSELKIFDLSSRLVQKNSISGQGMHSIPFDIRKNTSGVYLISLESAGKRILCEKLMVSR